MAVVYFLLLVGLLVIIHELGHFVAAKLLDVRVLRFSIGYGRPLVRFQLGETEYQLAIFPIGGYVRILGVEREEPDPRDVGRSFEARPLWQRIAIVFAGPVANFLLSGVVYFALFAGHRELPAAVIGDVLPDGPAARAGLEPGDKILAINGETVRYWEDVERAVQRAPGKELHLRLLHNGRTVEKYLVPIEKVVRRRDGSSRVQGWSGITHPPFVPIVGVLDPHSPAGRAGMQTGDLVVSVDGQEVDNWTDVGHRLGKSARRTNLVYMRGTEVPGIPQLRLLDARFADLVPKTLLGDTLKRTTYTGLERAEMVVAHVDPGSPADVAGLRAGDLVTTVDGEAMDHWFDLEQRLLSEPTKTWTVGWRRNQEGTITEMQAPLTQVWRKQLDEYGHTVTRLVFGARNDVARGRGVTTPIDGRISYAMSKAVERTGETMSMMVGGFSSILAGDSPSDALGGPLMMYKVASVSSSRGWESFWLMLALISINLGLINLLPVPMLDGGHLVVFAIEGVRREPLSERARERVQQVGLAIVLVITVLAVRNDVVRFFFK
jgi:regulator of sigma E protease